MPWKKDLAKLKQELKSEEPPQGKITPPPKAAVVYPVSQSIEEEDAIFLSAMGLRAQPKAREAAPAPKEAPPALVRVETPAAGAVLTEFNDAMGDLKGMKPIRRHPATQTPAPPPVAAAAPAPTPVTAPEPETPAAVPQAPVPLATPAKAEPGPTGAVLIHLAAGMAIEVDGGLDLKGHARSDAEERLKERILDGYALGWRTLHVTLGPAADLREMLLELLASAAGKCVARYAQAPIPMGGTQAWVLYFRGPGPAGLD